MTPKYSLENSDPRPKCSKNPRRNTKGSFINLLLYLHTSQVTKKHDKSSQGFQQVENHKIYWEEIYQIKHNCKRHHAKKGFWLMIF